MKDHFFFKRRLTKVLVNVVVFAQMLNLVVVGPVFAAAAVVSDPVVGTNTYLIATEMLRESAEEKVDQGFLAAGIASLIHASSYFMDKIAYDTAKAVAQGGKGLKSLVYEKDWGNYLEEVALDSAADFIDNFGKEALGIGLCQITDPHLLITLTLGFKSMYGAGGPQPDCTWQQLKNTWSPEAFEQRYGPGGKRFLAETFSANIKVSNSDFGIAINGIQQLDNIIKKDKEAAKEERQEGEGFKSVKDLITGNVKTPAQVVKQETSVASSEYKVKASNEALWGVAASGAKQVFIHAGSVFLNTLTSELLNQVLTKCWVNCGGSEDGAGTEGVLGFYSSPARNDVLSNNVFGELLAARPTAQLNNYDLISEFASCPDSPGVNNCVIDSDFQKILDAGRNGTPMTIQEALDKQLLHADWPLISPRRTAENASEKHDCYMGKYCYSNIQKLRKVSILPIGFEVAALRSDPDRPWTLGNVIKNFETCLRVDNLDRPDPTGTKVKEDPAYPFCHLINPNWIIRVSSFQCDGKVITNTLLAANSPLRREECLDVKTCLNEGENGSCGGAYGYCTQQKNIWRIPGETCPAEYNTCVTYTESKTRKNVSYLSRTLDPAECSIDNVGCRAYSMQKNGDGVWQGSSEIEKNIPDFLNNTPEQRNLVIQGAKDINAYHHLIFFDETIKAASSVCRPGNDGCNAFYPASRYEDGQYQKTEDGKFVQDKSQLVHLKKAPDYLGCYDSVPALRDDGTVDLNGLGIEWPETLADIESGVSQNQACNSFASVCTESEIGCEAYTPQNGGPMIPGMIGAPNVCSSQCVGYQTFKQEAGELAKFDNEKFPLFFIPTQGQSCEAKYAGCEEFTNIDTRSQGGERLEYYTDLKYCEKPATDGSNQKVFYTWEGSIREGLSLRTHQLMPISENQYNYIEALENLPDMVKASMPETSPAYADDSETALLDFDEKCNEESYNLRINSPYSPAAADPDCKAFYDDAGNVYYRLLSKLVTISSACHPIRKTKPEFVIDENLHGQAALCTSKGGFMNAENQCQRCLNGGRFENNFCVYQTISQPGEATSCPASQNGCRAYTGSSANNLQEVFNDDFEANNEEAGAALIANWRPLNAAHIAAEATHVGSHSLEVNAAAGTVSRRVAAGEFAGNGWYELTFWAKGAGKRMAVEFSQRPVNMVGGIALEQPRQVMGVFSLDPATRQPSLLAVDQEWRAYRLGPVQFTGSTSTAMSIDFQVQGDLNTPLYLDHVRLSQVRDHIYLKKDSWKTAQGYDVPEACDSAPLDSLPGEALGCAAYKDSKEQVRFATGFEKLCREKAVGCQPFWDTYNTVNGEDADKKHVFNLVCNAVTGRVSATRKCELYSQGVNAKKYGECQFKPGASFCYVPKVVIDDNTGPIAKFSPAAMVTSTIVVRADTASLRPIFLANRKEFQCGESERGCMKVGLEEQTLSTATVSSSFRYTDIMIKNDPELYTDSLCRDDLVGCGEFKSGSEISYFKDPKINGNALCTYKPQSEAGAAYGWYQEGVGTCANENSRLCRTNTDCSAGANCQNIGNVPCYSNYRRQGNVYDIWSNNTPEYTDLVGTCPAKYNLCTELIDPADTSTVNPLGQPYYVIFNKQVTARVGDCQGKVSLTEGCVLFNKTNEPNKLYNSIDTYSASSSSTPRYNPVIPFNNAGNNTNLILKVERDRICSRWLQCSTQVRQVSASGKPVDLCYAFRECEQLQGNICVKWVDDFETNSNIDAGKSRLTYDKYIRRGTSWYDSEYTGYSLYNKFRIQNMTYLVFDYAALDRAGYLEPADLEIWKDRQFVAYEMNPEYFTGEYSGSGCIPAGRNNSTEFKVCGYDNGGRCYNNKCIYPISGGFKADAMPLTPDNTPNNWADNPKNHDGMLAFLRSLDGNSCKGYSEASSPFENKAVVPEEATKVKCQMSVVKEGQDCSGENITKSRSEFIRQRPGFEKVNVCQDGNCSCGYQKITYGKNGTTDYWSFDNGVKIPDEFGVCNGGKVRVRGQGLVDATGYPCALDTADADCNEPPSEDEEAAAADTNFAAEERGVCTPISSRADHIGFKGYCLEYDLSRPTLIPGQPYECLTWLPIQVSASGADNYNADRNTGYYTHDKEGDNSALGQVFCSAGTNVGVGPYDTRYWQQNFAGYGSLNALYSAYFNDNGSPKVNNSIAGQFLAGCEGDNMVDTVYGVAICGNDDGGGYKNSIYTMLQAWLWKNQKPNSHILRFDYYPGDDEGRTAAEGWNDYGKYDDLGPNGNDRGIEVVYGLAPGQDYQGKDVFEMGTVMHPPRTWGDNNQLNTMANLPAVASYPLMQSMNPSRDDVDWSLNTFFMNPEIGDRNENRFVSRAYVSPMEKNLREADIKRVSFLPMHYTNHGTDDIEAPALFSQDLYIDFDELNKSPTGAMAHLGQQADDGGHFPSAVNGKDSIIWTYKIKQNQWSGKGFNFVNYDKFTNPTIAPLKTARNNIATRYVMVFTDWHGGGNDYVQGFIDSNVEENADDMEGEPKSASIPARKSHDPFSASCGTDDASDWLAVGMDFNADGEFLGYISRWCNYNGGDESDIAIELAVAAELHDSCTEFMVVDYQSGDPIRGTQNKAWTQRVTDITNQNHPWRFVNGTDGRNHYTNIFRNLSLKPFGSINLSGAQVMTVANMPWEDASFNQPDVNRLRNYVFKKQIGKTPTYAGIPYSCTANWLGMTDHFGRLIDGNLPTRCSGVGVGNTSDSYDTIIAGEEESNTTVANVQAQVRSVPDAATAQNAIFQLFALAKARVKVGYTNNQELLFDREVDNPVLDKSGPGGGLTVNQEGNYRMDLRPPQIYSTNPSRCGDDVNFEKPCSWGEANNMTVGNRNGVVKDYDGDGLTIEEDPDGNGTANAIIQPGSYSAVLKFFAFADDNRMPLRTVMVAWGDDSPIINDGRRGLYKNHKPFCDKESAIPVTARSLCAGGGNIANALERGLTCVDKTDCPGQNDTCIPMPTDNALRFGNSSRACSATPFQFVHEYTCSRSDIPAPGNLPTKEYVERVADLDQENRQRLNDSGFADNSYVCVFRPKVHAEDNWGWCNGSDDPAGLVARSAGYYGAAFCDSSQETPWTAYKGLIILTPPPPLAQLVNGGEEE